MATEQVDKLISFGNMALEQGWYDQAREYFEQALALDASNREAMKGLARVNEILSRTAAVPVKPIQAEPVKPLRKVERKRSIPEKKREEQERSLTQWFKRLSRRSKITILAGVPLLFLCLCAGLADMVSPTQETTPTAVAEKPPAETQIPMHTPAPTNTPVPTATPKPENVVKELVRKTLGTGNRDVDRISEIEMTSDGWVTVDWAINDSLTEGMIKTGAKLDVDDVAEALCQNGFCDGLTMHGSFSMKDAYGNVSEDVVVKVVLRPETLAKINWEHFDFHDIYLIADAVELHPAFQD